MRYDFKKLYETAVRTHIRDILSTEISNIEITEERELLEDFWISVKNRLLKTKTMTNEHQTSIQKTVDDKTYPGFDEQRRLAKT